MTKAVTAVAALRLVEAGRVGLDDSVEPWLPELADRRVLVRPRRADLDETVAAVRPITLRHLLTERLRLRHGARRIAAGAGHGRERHRGRPLPWTRGGRLAGPAGRAAARVPAGRGLALPPLLRGRSASCWPGVAAVRSATTSPTTSSARSGWSTRDSGCRTDELDRLPAAYRSDGGLVETEPAGGGPYAGPPRGGRQPRGACVDRPRLPPLPPRAGAGRDADRRPARLGRAPAR